MTKNKQLYFYGFWFFAFATLIAVNTVGRPIGPFNEGTRYLGAAWEMWTQDSWLVPLLNGAPYSHKPPLFFWLIHSGWWLFGVSDWWPRVVVGLFGFAGLLFTHRLARQLWPNVPQVAWIAPTLLLGSFVWLDQSSILFFDVMLTVFVLAGFSGLIKRMIDKGILKQAQRL